MCRPIIPAIAPIIVTVMTAAIVVTTVGVVSSAFVPMPFYDYWDHVVPSENWTYVYRKHNEHFVTLAVPFYWADTALFSAKGYFAVAVSWIFLALSAIVSAWAVSRDRAHSALMIPLAFALFFSGRQLENLTFPLQVSFTGACLVAVLATAAVAHGAIRAAALGSVVAPFFAAFGVAVAPAVALIGYCRRAELKWLVLILTAWLFTLGLYSIGNLHARGMTHSLSSPLDALRKIPIYLGDPLVSPFSANATASLIAGIILLCLAIFFTAQYCLRREATAAEASAIGLMLFGILGLTLTAVGRSTESDGPALRYVIMTAPLYVGLFSMIRRNALLAAVAVFITGALLTEQTTWRAVGESFGTRASAIDLWLKDQSNLSLLRPIYPRPESIAPQIDYLRQTKKSVFDE